MEFKRVTYLLLVLAIAAVFAHRSTAETLTLTKTGSQGGYTYELWNQNNKGTVSMDLKDSGNFSCSWTGIENVLFRKGIRPGVKNQVINFSSTYAPNGNSYLSVYGWTKNPLVEYYIVESWGSWRPPGGKIKTTITVDGDKYDIYETTRNQQPSIEGTKTFQQYWSVRQVKRTSGTIYCLNHFNAWAGLGMPIGSMYEVSFVVEGYQSKGTADVKMSMSTGSTGIGNTKTIQPTRATRGLEHINVVSGGSQAITFTVPVTSRVALKVYNHIGQEVAEFDEREYSAGKHSVLLNTSRLARGVYYCAMKTVGR